MVSESRPRGVAWPRASPSTLSCGKELPAVRLRLLETLTIQLLNSILAQRFLSPQSGCCGQHWESRMRWYTSCTLVQKQEDCRFASKSQLTPRLISRRSYLRCRSEQVERGPVAATSPTPLQAISRSRSSYPASSKLIGYDDSDTHSLARAYTVHSSPYRNLSTVSWRESRVQGQESNLQKILHRYRQPMTN